jgi:hypothetical protein
MNRNGTILVPLTALLAFADASAQVPTVSGGGVPGGPNLGSGPAPALVMPAPGAQIQTHPSNSVPLMFRWSAPSGAPAPQRYRLCVTESGTSCGAPNAAVYEAGQVTQYQAQIPPRFHDKSLQWSVAACGPGYGGTFARVGATNTDCNWSQGRALNASYQPPAISLGAPGDSTAASAASQRFTWLEPRGVAVDGYRFCLADNASACQQSITAAQGAVVSVPAGRSFVDIDISSLRVNMARQMVWTVLSCRGGNCRSAANQATRQFSIPALPAAPTLEKPTAGSVEPVKGDEQSLGYVRQTDNWQAQGVFFPASIDFDWSQVIGATAYRLCISPPGVACGTGASHVVNARFVANGSESQEWANLSRLHGQAVNWTVATCDAIGCGPWAQPRALTIKAVPGTVTLTAPGVGADLTSTQAPTPVDFTWSAVNFAERYEVLVGTQPVSSLRTATNQCRAPRAGLPLGPTEWKVRACNVVGCGPASSPRAITISPPLSSPATSSSGPAGRSPGAAIIGVTTLPPQCL